MDHDGVSPRHGRRLAGSLTSVRDQDLASEAIADYRTACLSRSISHIGRREVSAGRAKFGIFGDGKETAQVALARQTQRGDWRAGYYRDQTFVLATGVATPRMLFAQLYGDANVAREPASGGRQMNNHFATRLLDPDGHWLSQTQRVNSAAGFGAVAVQMASALGLAYASKLYRGATPALRAGFSNDGNEVVFASIGNGSAAEGIFFESVNAATVLQVPLVICVWDDEFAISVPNALQMAHGSVSRALSGMRASETATGLRISSARGWDYPALRQTMKAATDAARSVHVPALIHVTELTQPLGHSTSGSHERYKASERLVWEAEHDCLRVMRGWLIDECGFAVAVLEEIEESARQEAQAQCEAAWTDYATELRLEGERARDEIVRCLPDATVAFDDPISRRSIDMALHQAVVAMRGVPGPERRRLAGFAQEYRDQSEQRYRSSLYSESADNPIRVSGVAPTYTSSPEWIDGRQILLRFFDGKLSEEQRLFILGQDVAQLGDVNLAFEGLALKHGPLRVIDTGIREATILGQGIGAAMRGLRPIVDIQYLDYLLFALEVASDDLSTLLYRTAGGQKAPVIIRTKGHRLLGMTHSGSPMAVLLHACRGMYLCTPRDMTRAAGMYATLLDGDNPAVVVEVLNGYRIKEPVPANLSQMRVPLGIPETLRPGSDVTVVTYGAMCRIALEAAAALSDLGVDIEVIDIQTLNPFDIHHRITESVARTGAIVVADEDVPGGASAFLMREILEVQGAFQHLDAAPRTVTAAANRPAYGTDGDFFTKPGALDIVSVVYDVMGERAPAQFPPLY